MDRYFQFQNRKVHYVAEGVRPEGNCRAVLLLHGFTEAAFVWESLSRALAAEGYYVLCPDLAGHGGTESFSDVHGMDLQAAIARAVLEQEGIGKAVVIGHSMGGYVAAAFACLYPESVAGVGFFHSNPASDTPQGRENRLRTLKLLQAGHTSFLGDFVSGLFAPGNAEAFPQVVEALRVSAKEMGAEAVAAAQRGMLERASRLQVYDLPVPFLFIIGKRDSKADLAKVMAQTLLPAEAYVQLLPCGHMGMYECASQTEAFIAGYLKTAAW